MLSAFLFLLLNIILAVIVLEIILWVASAIFGFGVPDKIRKLLYALILVWALIGIIGILSGGTLLYWNPRPALR